MSVPPQCCCEAAAACKLTTVVAAVSHCCSDMNLQLSHNAEETISHYHRHTS